MKKSRFLCYLRSLTLILVMALCLPLSAANTKTTVTTVTTTVELTDDVDYIVTSDTPFGNEGLVNIVNTEHAVLILEMVKPSAAIKLLSHVQINGAQARNNTNCQVKIYKQGSIILPYGNNAKPLTVYAEQNFEGESTDNFGQGNTGGYMNTLTTAQLNNRIRSFKLKRGYMVTFSTLPNGRGYSRCFIASNADLEVKTLPAILDQKISSYRVFKWYDTGKKQLANSAGDAAALKALNVQSTYDWGEGNSSLAPDIEWVPNHIYEDWPSSATIGGTSQSPHTKNNNEPRNSADDHPQDLTTILNNWENMMRTGLRLCSPASWDGSDYWNATGFLAEFLDSIDARGWRCDIIDLHCYWPSDNFNNIANWANKYKRPVWISEWCWGASWSNNGAFASGVTEAQVATALESICTKLNGWNYVERYYYWNGERDPSRLYKNNKLTPAGEYYAKMTTDLAYKSTNYVPSAPKQKAASKLTVDFDDTARTATISWYDSNGEHNKEMVLERSTDGKTWTTIYTPEQNEAPSTYTYTDSDVYDGIYYRVRIKNMSGTTQYSAIVSTQIANVGVGQAITVDGQPMYIGGNLLNNSDFNQGLYGWTSGAGTTLALPYFQAVPVAGPDGGTYLQAYGSNGANDASSIKQYVAIQPNSQYVFSLYSCNGGSNMAVNVSADNTSTGSQAIKFTNSSEWQSQYKTFNSGTNNYALITFSQLGAKAQFDKMGLRQLFATQEEAIADGLAQIRLRAEDVKAYNTQLPQLNEELTAKLAAITTTSMEALTEIETAISQLLGALNAKQSIDSLLNVAEAIDQMGFNEFHQKCDAALANARNAATATAIIDARQQLKAALDQFLEFTTSPVQPQSPNFANGSTGWTTKAGTYKNGDQTIYTKGELTCWNAWWSGLNASTGASRTMEINQTVTDLAEGIYALECKASTEHYCISDQHAFMTYGDITAESPVLAADLMDLPVDNFWQTLTTTPVYVEEGGSVTIGFKGSKQGAVDNAWHRFGKYSESDKREGWWCATDFKLLYHPLYRLTTKAGTWGTICIPYAAVIPEGLNVYTIAGVLSSGDAIALAPATSMAAGVPYIYYAEDSEYTLFETGNPVKNSTYRAVDDNGLRGIFKLSIRVPVDGYELNSNGFWVKVTDKDNRPQAQHFGAFIQSLSKATQLETWDGLTMKLMEGGIAGDANGDGFIDVRDMSLILEHILNGTTNQLPPAADVNNDNTIDVRDMSMLLDIILGNI